MGKTIRLTMAQALLRFLDNQYVSIDGQERKFVKGVMGIFGHGNVTGLGEALERSRGELLFIQGKNEQGMAHAATAYAKQHNRLEMFACTSSIGPGALNMITAAATATVNRIPLLLLPGDIFATRQPDPVLQQVEHPMDYTVSANDAFKPVSRFWDRISRPEQLMSSALHAMRVLTDPAETGAVTLSLPQDVQAEAFEYPVEFFEKRIHLIERRVPSKEALERAVDLIVGNKEPLLIIGGGVHYSLACKELIAFAEAFGIPMAETQAGKSAVPWNHPLYLGGVGVTGSLAANRIAQEADLIISVGSRLSDFTTASKSAFHPEARVLNINVSSMDTVKLNGVALLADAKTAMQELTVALSEKGYRSAHNMDDIEKLRKEWNAEVDRLYSIELEQGLAQTRVLGEINRSIGDDAVIVCAAGSMPGDLHRVWRSNVPKSYHMEYGFSCMGYEVAGAFGIKLANPDKEVYALVGDGSYLMMHSELVTSLQERRKINILLLDNHGFQCIHGLQRAHGSDSFGNEFRYRSEQSGNLDGEYLQIDFAAQAAGLGAQTYSVRTIQQLQEALEHAKKSSVSTLIDIKVLPGTGTDGYESWWRVDTAEVSMESKVKEARRSGVEKLQQARIMY